MAKQLRKRPENTNENVAKPTESTISADDMELKSALTTGTSLLVAELQQIGPTEEDSAFDPKEWAAINKEMSKNESAGDVQISRLGVAQPLTPEVVEKQPGWTDGLFYDSVCREPISLYAKAPWLLKKGIPASDLKAQYFLPFIPVFKLPSEYVEWPTKEERQEGIKQFKFKTLDQHDPRVRAGIWPPKGVWKAEPGGSKAPPITEHMNILGLGLDMEGQLITNPIIASFSRTSFSTGRKFYSNAKQGAVISNQPIFGRVYYLYLELVKFTQGSSQVYQFAKGEKLLDFTGKDTDVFLMAFRLQKELTASRELQELYLNAAKFAGEEAYEEGGETEEDDAEPSF